MRIVVSRAAAADLERLHSFLADKNPAAARQAVAALVAASGVRDMRELIVPFGRSAYVLRYAYSAATDEAIIIRIWHGREARE
jgi:plasmid stabilization system protein ParE